MYGAELIKKYFSHHPNSEFDLEFRVYGGFFCGCRNSIFKFERLYDRNILISYEDVTELRNVPIVKEGKRYGHYRLGQPHTTFIKSGSFICVDVKKIIEKEPTKTWRNKDVKIKRKLWNKNLLVHIDNDNLNLYIECSSILPYTLTNEKSKNSGLQRPSK